MVTASAPDRLERRRAAQSAYDRAFAELREHTEYLDRLRKQWMADHGTHDLREWAEYCRLNGEATRARRLRDAYVQARTVLGDIELWECIRHEQQ